MTEKQLIRKVKGVKHVLIYGAGMVGGLVYRRLLANGLENKVSGFAVSQKGKQDFCQGKPVKEIAEWPDHEDTLVIIATLMNFHQEIAASLQGYTFADIIRVESALFRSLEKAYVRDFLKENPFPPGKRDIAFMASDNNSASGAFLCLTDLNQELNRNGISTAVILPAYGDGEKILKEKGIGYTYILSEDWLIEENDRAYGKKLWRLWQNGRAIKKLSVFLRDHGVRLVHNNTTYTYVGAVAAHKCGIPVVWHLRENIADQGYRFFNGEWARRLLNRSARLIYISERMAACRPELDQGLGQIVYDGVDVDVFYGEHTIMDGFPEVREIRILLPGRVTAYKGQRDLFEAAGMLRERMNIKICIDLIGKEDADYRKELEELADRQGIREWIHFHGMQDDVAGFYHRSDISVVCSAVEAFGRVTVEAQLAGCLVIGANAGATPELIQHRKTGLLYQKGNIEELADQIIWAAEHPKEAGEIARNGQEYARGLYSKERNAQEIMNVYESILGKRGKEKKLMLNWLSAYPQLYLYSAGNRAKAITQMIHMGFLQNLSLAGYIVTRREGNRESLANEVFLDGLPVHLVEEFKGEKEKSDTAVLVVAMEHYHEEIRASLAATRFTNIFYLTDAMERVLVDDCVKWYFERHGIPYHYAGHVAENRHEGKLQDLDVTLFRVQSEVDVPLSETVPSYEYIVPLQAGAALAGERVCAFGDDMGDNISAQNRYYNELSCLYWVWKNTDHKYSGICHYRRLFESDHALTPLIEGTADVILPSPAIVYPDLKGYYLGWGLEVYYVVMLAVIRENYADYYETACWCAGHNVFIPNNICIADREILDDYCRFLFGVLFEVEERIEGMDTEKQKRCWLSEHVSTIYFMKRIREDADFRYCFADIVRYW